MANLDPNCVFCQIIKGQIPSTKVFEDEGFLAIKDIHPITLGHTVVFSKNHYAHIEEMPEEQRGQLFNIAIKVANQVVKEVDAQGYNLLVCSNEVAQSGVAHRPHIHVIPRKVGDNLKIDPRG